MPLIYMHYHGLNKQEVGIMQCIAQTVAFPACILWTAIADRYEWRRRVMGILSIISAGSIFVFSVPNLPVKYLAPLVAQFYFFLAAIVSVVPRPRREQE